MARSVSDSVAPGDGISLIEPLVLPRPQPATERLAAYASSMVLVVMLVGCLFRIIAAERLTPHVDEAASVLAAHAVAERGVPVLPSGTVYFQGATLSYLLAPFVWLGFGSLDDLALMRGLSVVAGTLAIYLAFRLGQVVAGDWRAGLLAALFVAMDPLSVQWSGHVRMYGLLQAVTLALVWVLVLASRVPSSGRLAALSLLFWVAVFTHIEAALLWPAMALVGLLGWRTLSSRNRWYWLASLGSAALAPVALLAINDLLGTASVETGAKAVPSKVSFVGDHLLAPLALVRNVRDDFNPGLMLHMNNLIWWVPGVIVALGTLAAAWCWWRRGAGRGYQRQRSAVIALLLCYWLPILGVGLFSISPKERYLLHVHLIGYVLLATVFVRLAGPGATRQSVSGRVGHQPWARFLTGAIVVILAVGLGWRFFDPVVHADHVAASEYVVEHRDAGDLVIVALPAVTGLMLGDLDHLAFLAGTENQSRAERLTRMTPDGLVDYWMGVEAIVSAKGLEQVLRDHPGAWVVVDRDRLAADWAYRGDIAATLDAWTEPVYEAAGGALVLRVPPGP